MPESPPRLPDWVRKPGRRPGAVHALKRGLRSLNLHTVCETARCPNLDECFARGATTFLILGDLCTRQCGFCAAPKTRPREAPPAPDPREPAAVARMAARLELRYVVVTSVTRDDLEDGGAAHFAATARELRQALPEARIELLTPDFSGDAPALAQVLGAAPDVFAHNLETVPRLYRQVRPQARYQRSLEVLTLAARHSRGILIKSGLMAGLGEEPHEIEQTLRDLREAGVDIVTIGQYLQPSRRHLPVADFVPPWQFEAWREFGQALGFRAVLSGPLVRSSYLAEAAWGMAAGGRAC